MRCSAAKCEAKAGSLHCKQDHFSTFTIVYVTLETISASDLTVVVTHKQTSPPLPPTKPDKHKQRDDNQLLIKTIKTNSVNH